MGKHAVNEWVYPFGFKIRYHLYFGVDTPCSSNIYCRLESNDLEWLIICLDSKNFLIDFSLNKSSNGIFIMCDA